MSLKVGKLQKIAMIKAFRAYGERIMEAMGFGNAKDRQRLLASLYTKQAEDELTEDEEDILNFLKRIDSVNSLKFAKDYTEELEVNGELEYSLDQPMD